MAAAGIGSDRACATVPALLFDMDASMYHRWMPSTYSDAERCAKGKKLELALQVQLASCKTLAVQSCCRLFCPHSPHHWPCEPRRGETASDPSLDPSLGQPAASDPIPQGPQGPCFAPAPQQARRRPPPPRRRRGHRLEGRQRQSRRRSASPLRSREYRTRQRRRRRPRSRARAWSATTRALRPPRRGKRGTRRFGRPCRLIT